MSKAVSKVVGESVQDLVIEDVDEFQEAEVDESWGKADADYWHDATPEVALFASDQVPMAGTCVIEPEQPVEIKAACVTISMGTRSRCGRFYIRRRQHERLVEAGGVYLFVLYEEDGEDQELLGMLAIPAVIVEDELRDTWYSVDGREDYYQLSADRLPIDGAGGDAGAE